MLRRFFILICFVVITIFLEDFSLSATSKKGEEPPFKAKPKWTNLSSAGNVAITVQIDPGLYVKPTKQTPQYFSLEQNYPNPFNASTVIKYSCAKNVFVTLKVYNVLGQSVVTLVSEQKNAGTYSVFWDSQNDQGNPVASGVYFYRLVAGEFVETKKLIILR
ncbi:MAG: T9SS type A sorting domain-containing protein [Ignavibacteriae bacterium]|nr:T9SS type A sorting domain-containing protein [Ignavibacteriota bacterium]